MSNITVDYAKGQVAYYAGLPAVSDCLVIGLLKATGSGGAIEADPALADYADLAALLASTKNDELTDASYVRKSQSTVTVTVDTTNDRTDLSMGNQTWTALAGADASAKAWVAYNPDTTANTTLGTGHEANLKVLTLHDFAVTPDGSDVSMTVGLFDRIT